MERGLLDRMLPLRAQILNGDYRVLFLAWLYLVTLNPEIEEDRLTPEIPPNLKTLDYSLDSFIDFWEIDGDLIAAAGESSLSKKLISDEDLVEQISHLSEQEKEHYLKALFKDETRAKLELRKRLAEMIPDSEESSFVPAVTLGELQQELARQHELRKAREKREAEETKRQKMEDIGKRQLSLWKLAQEQAGLISSKGYDNATEILSELKEYAEYTDSLSEFEEKFEPIFEKYGKSIAFRRRLGAKGIIQ